jgi:hypothetical protein
MDPMGPVVAGVSGRVCRALLGGCCLRHGVRAPGDEGWAGVDAGASEPAQAAKLPHLP